MYGLPPPPKLPTVVATGLDGKPLFAEPSNTITWPKEELVVGEGTYTLRDDLHLATPPHHPSDPPIFNPNPLSTVPTPPTAGLKLCVTEVPVRPPRPQASRLASAFTPGVKNDKLAEVEKESRESLDTGADTGTATSESGSQLYGNKVPVYGAGNSALTPVQPKEKDKDKKRKPRTDLKKTSSSFISRFVPKEDLAKRLESRNGEYLALFANVNRSFCWLDITESNEAKKENLTKILFAKAHALCHDLNEVTKRADHVDLVMGTNVSDIIWYEPMSQKYSRINKNGAVNPSPVSHIRWIPGSENLFLAAHENGMLVVYDKERDDAPFQPEYDAGEYALETPVDERVGMDFGVSDPEPIQNPHPNQLSVHKSINSKNQKTNPVASYFLCCLRINGFAFSPDGRHLAVVSEDRALRIIDYLTETLLDRYDSYFGEMKCVCWSPDGRYIVTGSQDDLVSVFSREDRSIVCRGTGHRAWVSAVAFDPWRCDGRDYRFGSVGEDGRLLLWDFTPSMIVLPRAARRGHAGSVASVAPGAAAAGRTRAESLASLRLRSTTSLPPTAEDVELDSRTFVHHKAEMRASVNMIPPVLNKVVNTGPLSSLIFREDCIITASDNGHIKTWDRPKEFGFEALREAPRPESPKSKDDGAAQLKSEIS